MNKRFRSWQGIVALLMVVAVLVAFVGGAPNLGTAKSVKGDEFYAGKTPKYVFMFIGDGMSYAQVNSAQMYLGQKEMPGQVTPKQLNFSEFPTHGALMTQDSTSFIPDSASTATSLASGYKTLSGVINMDKTKTTKYKPITEDLKENGYKIGVVTSVPITHATPAAFYAKVANRMMPMISDSSWQPVGSTTSEAAPLTSPQDPKKIKHPFSILSRKPVIPSQIPMKKLWL